MRRLFTADFHLGMKDILKYENRPFKTIEEMDKHFIMECCRKAKVYKETLEDGKQLTIDRDVIIHVGDLAMFGEKGLTINPQILVSQIPAMFINLKGNHDVNNKVKSIGNVLRTKIGKHSEVSISHYPSYDRHAEGTFKEGDIHICGHVHGKWKHCLDMTNKVLNINVGVDVWNYTIVTEDELIEYIDKVMKFDKNQLQRIIKAADGRYVRV